jgi:SsrA-binding protein
MGKKDKKKRQSSGDSPNERLVVENRKARHKYVVLETLECGIALRGSEVKSLRQGKISLDESYARVKNDEVWLVGCDIQEYSHASRMNHEPKRPRKLLLHRREIRKFAGQAFEKGLTLVPLRVYFKKGIAKLLLGICRGKKLYDKREQMKKDTVRREIDRALRRR